MAKEKSQTAQMELSTLSCRELCGSLGHCVKFSSRVVAMKGFYTVEVLCFKLRLKKTF
jgi:hypothetical protein